MQGIVQKIMTLTDGSIRFMVDVPAEICPDDLKAWMYQYVTVTKAGEITATPSFTAGDAEGRAGEEGKGTAVSRKSRSAGPQRPQRTAESKAKRGITAKSKVKKK